MESKHLIFFFFIFMCHVMCLKLRAEVQIWIKSQRTTELHVAAFRPLKKQKQPIYWVLRAAYKEDHSSANHPSSPSKTSYTMSPTDPTQVNMAADGYDAKDTSRTMTLTLLCLHLLLHVFKRLLMTQFCGRWAIHMFTYHIVLMIELTLPSVTQLFENIF